MRLLIVTEDFVPNIGGIATFLSSLCNYTNNRVTVIAPRRSKSEYVYDEFKYEVKRVTLRKRLGFVLISLAIIFQILRGSRVILWGHVTPLVLIGLCTKIFFRTKLAVLVHGKDLNISVSHRWLGNLVKFVLRHSDLVFANSQYNANNLIDLGVPQPKVHVLHPGVDIERFRPLGSRCVLKSNWKVPGSWVMLSVGQLIPRKNHRAVLRVMAQINRKGHKIAYLITSTGNQESSLKKLAKDLKLESAVRFLGIVSDNDLVDLYNTCDVFVLPVQDLTKYGDVEGFGIAFAEASACGKPVITGKSGGAIEAVQHGVTGLLVDPWNDNSLLDAITTLMADPPRAQAMGAAGRLFVVRELSWPNVAKRFDRALESLNLQK